MSRGRQSGFHLYSVYDKKTSLPLIIDGTYRKCAEVMGMRPDSFFKAVKRFEESGEGKWEVFKTGFIKKRTSTRVKGQISKKNIEVLKAFIACEADARKTAEKIYMDKTNVYYHLWKFRDFCGLSPLKKKDLEQLKVKFKNELAEA